MKNKGTEFQVKQENVPNCNFCGIKHHGVLQTAEPETLEKINQGKNFHIYPKNSLIFSTGEKATGFYFIRKGLVRSFKLSSNKEQTFNLKGPGDWIGFRDALAGDSYFHSAECMEDVEACFVSRTLAEVLIQEDVNFQTEVFRQMAKEWRESEQQIVSLGTKQVHGKLAELLLTLKKGSGDSPELELKITREILATIIGTKTETLVRAIADLKNRDIIQVEKNRIIIKDTQALEFLSEFV